MSTLREYKILRTPYLFLDTCAGHLNTPILNHSSVVLVRRARLEEHLGCSFPFGPPAEFDGPTGLPEAFRWNPEASDYYDIFVSHL